MSYCCIFTPPSYLLYLWGFFRRLFHVVGLVQNHMRCAVSLKSSVDICPIANQLLYHAHVALNSSKMKGSEVLAVAIVDVAIRLERYV